VKIPEVIEIAEEYGLIYTGKHAQEILDMAEDLKEDEMVTVANVQEAIWHYKREKDEDIRVMEEKAKAERKGKGYKAGLWDI